MEDGPTRAGATRSCGRPRRAGAVRGPDVNERPRVVLRECLCACLGEVQRIQVDLLGRLGLAGLLGRLAFEDLLGRWICLVGCHQRVSRARLESARTCSESNDCGGCVSGVQVGLRRRLAVSPVFGDGDAAGGDDDPMQQRCFVRMKFESMEISNLHIPSHYILTPRYSTICFSSSTPSVF
jgi:hypothetical protein